MTDKLKLKSSHEVVYTVYAADVESIFYCKPDDPDILTVLMKDGKRLYCDEVCPIDSLQEEPVSIWHDTGEIPKEGALILREIGVSQKGYGVIRYSKEIPNFPKHCEDIPMQRWAYIDDILNLSNVQRAVKNCKEPVSDDLEEASKEWLKPQLDKSYADYGEVKMMELTHFDGYAMLDAIEFGAEWQKGKMMKGAVEGEVSTTDYGKTLMLRSEQQIKSNFYQFDKVKLVIIKED